MHSRATRGPNFYPISTERGTKVWSLKQKDDYVGVKHNERFLYFTRLTQNGHLHNATITHSETSPVHKLGLQRFKRRLSAAANP